MDFMDLVARYNEEYGMVDDDWEKIRTTTILTFVEENGKISSRYNGVPVYRDRDFEKTIFAGETWICSLDKSKLTFYFAKGIQRIDSAFMFELKSEQRDEIVSCIWEKQRRIIEPILEEKYREVAAKNLEQATEETRSKYEAEIKTLKDSIHNLEQKETENKQIIESLHEKLNAKNSDAESQSSKPAGVPELMPFGSASNISVKRSGPDTIISDAFNKSRYFVHLSADHRTIVIRPHEQGNVVCMNNTIVLERLGLISSFNGPYDMVSEYSPLYGGIQIYL
ncbi:MAG: hypothetical protein FWE78_04355 [Methanimicrococcus sp.]|nr:hypothetical protein [Methanimicrococcus sp.]